VPAAFLANAHHWLILHGRYVCLARRPLCEVCAVALWCESAPLQVRRAAAAAVREGQAPSQAQRLTPSERT
jgi:adenine-specific DNA glycosylase